MSHTRPIAIITGAAQGIGRGLALGFAERGYQVCALDIQPMATGEAHIAPYHVDVADAAAIAATFAQISRDWGAPSVLINNAAISKFSKPMAELDVADFAHLITTNLTGYFACAKAFVALHQGLPWGRIINIASTRWNQNEPDWEAYGASKGGVVSLTNSLCVSLQGTGITVNAISPGWIHCGDESELVPLDHSQHPSGRVGRPEDILRACLFLCEQGNDFINGHNLVIDGGMTKRMIYES